MIKITSIDLGRAEFGNPRDAAAQFAAAINRKHDALAHYTTMASAAASQMSAKIAALESRVIEREGPDALAGVYVDAGIDS